MQKILSLPQPFKLNNKDHIATVDIYAELDHLQPEDVFEFQTDIDSVRSGKFDLVSVKVAVSFCGMLGVDYLGAVHVHSGWEAAGTGQADILACVKNYGMIDNAKEDLLSAITNLLNEIK